MHAYYERKIAKNTQIDKHLSNSWKKDKFVTTTRKLPLYNSRSRTSDKISQK